MIHQEFQGREFKMTRLVKIAVRIALLVESLLILPTGLSWAEAPKSQTPVRFSGDKPQLLVTAEYMTVDKLTDPKLMALLKKHEVLVAPCIRDYQLGTEAGQKELDRLFTAYEREGIGLVFWPLTSRREGLYLNQKNAKSFYDYLDKIYTWADRYQHPIMAMIVDIEPLNFQGGDDRSPEQPQERNSAAGDIFKALKGMDRKCFRQAKSDFMQIQEKLHRHGTIAISTALDFAALDIVMRTGVWEDLAGGPTMAVNWDYVSFMNFGSQNQKFLGGLPRWKIEDTRYLSYRLGKAVFRKYGKQAGISTGQTIPGEGHGAVWTDPADLAKDVAALKAAGIMHFGIYDLQGIARSQDPEAWIKAVKDTPAKKPKFRFKSYCLYQTLKGLTAAANLFRCHLHHQCGEEISNER
jgi:hypothetical protein